MNAHSNDAILIYTTFPSILEAENAGRDLVAKKLAACVNILPSMTSIYEWENTVERAEEVVMLVKTTRECETRAIKEIVENHSYDTPAAIVLPIEGGSSPYLHWIASQVGAGEKDK